MCYAPFAIFAKTYFLHTLQVSNAMAPALRNTKKTYVCGVPRTNRRISLSLGADLSRHSCARLWCFRAPTIMLTTHERA